MAHMIVSFFAAFAVAYSVYGGTSSLLWALLAYSLTGTLVMLIALAATAVLTKLQSTPDIQAVQA